MYYIIVLYYRYRYYYYSWSVYKRTLLSKRPNVPNKLNGGFE